MFTEIVRRAAAEFTDTPAFVASDGWTISYAELDSAADEAAEGLRERGIGDGDVVALVLPSTIDYVVLYLGAERIGAVTAGLNPRFRPREIAGALAVVEPDLAFVSEELRDGVDFDLHRTEVIGRGSSAESAAGEVRMSGAPPRPALPDDPSRPVCICFTSGSTGAPKGAWYTNRQLATIAHLDTGGAWGGGGHGIASTQFAHVGFMTKLPWMLAAGRTTHLVERWSAEPIMELMAEHRMAAVTAIAPQIALMLNHPRFDDFDFSAVKAIVAGGAASPPALVREARERFGAPYSIRYSSTESGGIGLGTALDADDEEALHSIGRPRPGVDAEIRGEDGVRVVDGEIGELWLRSGAMMEGYWNDPDATAQTLVDGWLRTGDLAWIDAAGAFHLAGRAKEMFIRGGYNVYPLEVESILTDHPGVAEIAVVPRPDPIMGEIGVAVVVPVDAAAPPTLDELRSFGEDGLAHFKLPEAIRIVDALPRNVSDKIDRRALAEPEAT